MQEMAKRMGTIRGQPEIETGREMDLTEILDRIVAVADSAAQKEAVTDAEALTLRIVKKGQACLQKLFDQYNRRYWDEVLPRYRLVISKRHGGAGCCDTRNHLIFVHPSVAWDSRHAKATLLHEMAHAFAPANGHGERWQHEMQRLARLRAPIDKTDLRAHSQTERHEPFPTRRRRS